VTTTQRDAIDEMLRHAPFDLGGDLAVQRPLFEQMLTAHALPDDVVVAPRELGGVKVIGLQIADVEVVGTVLHLHGGGFAIGSARASLGLAADLARRTQMRVLSVDYRLAPEHPYPAALSDVSAAYEALVAEVDATHPIVVTGESAGGNLALALLVARRRDGLDMPAAIVLMSPMTDLTVSGPSFVSKAAVDPVLSAQAIRTRVDTYLAGADSSDALVSPVNADLSGLPAMLIQVGSHEVLLDDSTRLAARAAADDVAVTLDVTPGVPHVFQAFAGILDEGDAALERIARFVEHAVEASDGAGSSHGFPARAPRDLRR